MDRDPLDGVLSGLTPEALEALIRRLASVQGPRNHSGVNVPDIISALTEGVDLGAGAAGWQRHLRLKQAVIDTVAGIPGMRYVEGDA